MDAVEGVTGAPSDAIVDISTDPSPQDTAEPRH